MTEVTINKSELDDLIMFADLFNDALIDLDVGEYCVHQVKELFVMSKFYESLRGELEEKYLSNIA